MRMQQTLNRPVSLEGFGFWTGEDVLLEFRPAVEDFGITFVRTDLPQGSTIPASVDYRIDKPRQTTLVRGVAQVDMIEHVMAALSGLGIDNCEIRVNGSEMPGMDGSAIHFVQLLKSAGIKQQAKERRCRVVEESFVIPFATGQIEVSPSPTGKTVFSYSLEYSNDSSKRHPIGKQSFTAILTPEFFEEEVAPARTFLMLREAEYLRSNGLCHRVRPCDALVFGESGPIDNVLRFDNEPARHKVLDMIGDFALSGIDWIAHFHGIRTGHEQNATAVAQLLAKYPV